jgi:hypothetical protein
MLRRHLIFSENERPLFPMTLYDRVYVLLALPRNSPQSPPNDRDLVELQPQRRSVIAA